MENTITKKVKQLSRTQQGISLTKENRENKILEDLYYMNPQKETEASKN